MYSQSVSSRIYINSKFNLEKLVFIRTYVTSVKVTQTMSEYFELP